MQRLEGVRVWLQLAGQGREEALEAGEQTGAEGPGDGKDGAEEGLHFAPALDDYAASRLCEASGAGVELVGSGRLQIVWDSGLAQHLIATQEG